MKATRISPSEYARLFPAPSVVYNSVEFSELNSCKCQEVHYIALTDDGGKVRLGATFGMVDCELRMPFSAPFGCIEEPKPQQVSYYVDAIDALKSYGDEHKCRLRLTLPPVIYSRHSHIEKQYLAAITRGAELLYTDYSHAMPLSRDMDVLKLLTPQSRRKYKASVRAGLECRAYDASDFTALEEAYSVIKIHHEAHGYPVRMTFDNLRDTIARRMVGGSVYMVSHGGCTVAAAINYHHPSGIVQGVYWGNIPESAGLSPMNNIAVEMSIDFARQGLRWFDLGPSSIRGVPDAGLCLFKESLGFGLFTKPTLMV